MPGNGFSATLAVDDPFVADEFGIRLSHGKDESGTATTDLAIDYAKTITPDSGLSIGTDYLRVKPEDGEPEGFRQYRGGCQIPGVQERCT